MKRVVIVVPNWNGGQDTLACLESLACLDYPAFQVIVVDNGSTDDSMRLVRERFPGITAMEQSRNLGFTGGNNVGLRWALQEHADYALLLNNDTVVAPDFLRLLVEAAESDPAIGMVGPMIHYLAEPQTIWSAGGSLDRQRGQTDMVGLNERDTGQFGAGLREVDFLTGCALLVKGAVLEQAGLLDDRFFMYYEDTEWCARARRAGFRIVHVPQAHIWHKISPEAREASPQVHYYMTRNRLLLLKAMRAEPVAWVHTLFEYLRTASSWGLRPKWRGKRLQLQAMLLGISDAARGRWGQRSLTSKL